MEQVSYIPSNQDLEVSTIGAMMKDNNALHYGVNRLDVEDFFSEINSFNFNLIKESYEESRNVDFNLLTSKINLAKKEEAYKYTSKIKVGMEFSDSGNIEKYCDDLKDFAFRRNVSSSADELRRISSDLSIDIDSIHKELDSIKESGIKRSKESALTVDEAIEQDSKEIVSLKTGVAVWDNTFYKEGGRGLGTTELVFARPGHGKTFYLALKEAMFAKMGYKGLHFQLEDTRGEFGSRIRAIITGYENNHLLNNVLIDKKRNLRELINTIRIYKYKMNIKWVSVDHIGRVKVPEFRNDRVSAMACVTNSLTDLCGDENIFGMFSVQPNKSWKGRKGWDNVLREEDLKGATEIFEDAFVVTTLFRPNIYPELRAKKDGVNVVIDQGGRPVNYNSVFASQIKNRRQKITDFKVNLIQEGNRLIFDPGRRTLLSSRTNGTTNGIANIGDEAPF